MRLDRVPTLDHEYLKTHGPEVGLEVCDGTQTGI